ncbi:hypothetical protein ABD77_07080 [Brevibacillus formosus]|nr:hypothetical protein [Brevibacillus formosus]
MGCKQYDLIDRIKDVLTIIDAAEMIGVKFRRRGGRVISVCCPFHDDKSPSFAIWPESNRWKCFGSCGSGDQIDLMARHWELPLQQTIERLASELNIQVENTAHDLRLVEQRKEEANLIGEFNRQEKELFGRLARIEHFIEDKLSEIKTVQDLDKLGDLYLLRTEVNWALDKMQKKSLEDKIEGFSIGKAVLKRWLGS